MAIPSQQDYNRWESGPVAREREMGTLDMCIIYTDQILYFYFIPPILYSNVTNTHICMYIFQVQSLPETNYLSLIWDLVKSTSSKRRPSWKLNKIEAISGKDSWHYYFVKLPQLFKTEAKISTKSHVSLVRDQK